MTPEQVLTQDIEAHQVLAIRVGKRVSPDYVRDDKPLPAIAYQRLSTSYFHTITAPSAAGIASFEVYVMASTRTDSITVGDLFESAMRAAGRYCSERRMEWDADYDIYSTVFTVTVPFD